MNCLPLVGEDTILMVKSGFEKWVKKLFVSLLKFPS